MGTNEAVLDQEQTPKEIVSPPLKGEISGLSDFAEKIGVAPASEDDGVIDLSLLDGFSVEEMEAKDAEAARKSAEEEKKCKERQAFLKPLPEKARKMLLIRRTRPKTTEAEQAEVLWRQLLDFKNELYRGEHWCVLMAEYVADAADHGKPDFHAVWAELAKAPLFFREMAPSVKLGPVPAEFRRKQVRFFGKSIALTYPPSMEGVIQRLTLSLQKLGGITRKQDDLTQKEQGQNQTVDRAKFVGGKDPVTIHNLDTVFGNMTVNGPEGVFILRLRAEKWTDPETKEEHARPEGEYKLGVHQNELTLLKALGSRDFLEEAYSIISAAVPLYLNQVTEARRMDFTEDQKPLLKQRERLNMLFAFQHRLRRAFEDWEWRKKKDAERSANEEAVKAEATISFGEFELLQKKGVTFAKLPFFQPVKDGKKYHHQWVLLQLIDRETGSVQVAKTGPADDLFSECSAPFEMGQNYAGAPEPLRRFLRHISQRNKDEVAQAKEREKLEEQIQSAKERQTAAEHELIHQDELAANPAAAAYEEELKNGDDETSSASEAPASTEAEVDTKTPAPKRKRASKKSE